MTAGQHKCGGSTPRQETRYKPASTSALILKQPCQSFCIAGPSWKPCSPTFCCHYSTYCLVHVNKLPSLISALLSVWLCVSEQGWGWPGACKCKLHLAPRLGREEMREATQLAKIHRDRPAKCLGKIWSHRFFYCMCNSVQ